MPVGRPSSASGKKQRAWRPGGPASGGLVWTDERPGADRYVVYALREGADPSQRIGLVFERSGFVRWRLVGLRLAGAP